MEDKKQTQTTLLEELGLGDIPQDKQQELMVKMTEVILKRIFVETMDRLSQADQEAYGQLIEKPADPKEIEKFLREKIADYDQLLEKVVADFKTEMKKASA